MELPEIYLRCSHRSAPRHGPETPGAGAALFKFGERPRPVSCRRAPVHGKGTSVLPIMAASCAAAGCDGQEVTRLSLYLSRQRWVGGISSAGCSFSARRIKTCRLVLALPRKPQPHRHRTARAPGRMEWGWGGGGGGGEGGGGESLPSPRGGRRGPGAASPPHPPGPTPHPRPPAPGPRPPPPRAVGAGYRTVSPPPRGGQALPARRRRDLTGNPRGGRRRPPKVDRLSSGFFFPLEF